MKSSELIAKLAAAIGKHGDLDVHLLDDDPAGWYGTSPNGAEFPAVTVVRKSTNAMLKAVGGDCNHWFYIAGEK